MRALLMALLSLGACAAPSLLGSAEPRSLGAGRQSRALVAAPSTPVDAPVDIHDYPCMPGNVVLWHTSPAPCDLVGGVNTLTLLGLTARECDDTGGVWVYEACERVDF